MQPPVIRTGGVTAVRVVAPMESFDESEAAASQGGASRGAPGSKPPAPPTPRARGSAKPGSPRLAPHNFCAASGRDTIVFGCNRPGHSHPVAQASAARSPRGPLIPSATVASWVAFLKSRGVERVITLLSDEELTFFASPFLPALQAAFKDVVHVPPHRPGARATILTSIAAAVAAKEKVVVHCTTVRALPLPPPC